jgi:hypothetical protein
MPNSLPFDAFSADHVSSTSQAAPASESRANALGVTSKFSSTATPAGAPRSDDEVRANALSDALSQFLLSRANIGPLIISVEGEWGCGRSTFLLTLEQHLRERSRAKPAKGITHNVPLIAKFNPSRHCKDEPLEAAFAGRLTKKITSGQNFRERLKGHVRLFLCPFTWRRGWVDTLKTGTVFLIGTRLLFSLLALRPHSRKTWLLRFAKTVHIFGREKGKPEQKELPTSPTGAVMPATGTAVKPEQNAGYHNVKGREWFTRLSAFGFFGGLAVYLIAVTLVASSFRMVFSTAANLSKHMQSANPDRKLSLFKACLKDLPRVVEAYARDKKIFVFIEDLDRCAVPQAMELMQAINLLISTELKSIVIVVGTGRIPGGLAIKHADVLSQLRNRARCISIVS